MKKILNVILLCLLTMLLCFGCAKKAEPIRLPLRDDVVSIGFQYGDVTAFTHNTQPDAKTDIDNFYSYLQNMAPTNKESVYDAPQNVDYIQIDINTFDNNGATIFYYKDKGKEYVEQPYQGIYEPTQELGTYITEILATGVDEPASVSFYATVIESDGDTIIVRPQEGSTELNDSDKIVLRNKGNLDIKAGNTIEVKYNGEMLMTYPASLGEVYAITLIVDDNETASLADRRPMIRINGKLYYDTGKIDDNVKCGTPDGYITSTVEQTEIPNKNGQSNFGTGYEWQLGKDENKKIVHVDEKWIIFEALDETIPQNE